MCICVCQCVIYWQSWHGVWLQRPKQIHSVTLALCSLLLTLGQNVLHQFSLFHLFTSFAPSTSAHLFSCNTQGNIAGMYCLQVHHLVWLLYMYACAHEGGCLRLTDELTVNRSESPPMSTLSQWTLPTLCEGEVLKHGMGFFISPPKGPKVTFVSFKAKGMCFTVKTHYFAKKRSAGTKRWLKIKVRLRLCFFQTLRTLPFDSDVWYLKSLTFLCRVRLVLVLFFTCHTSTKQWWEMFWAKLLQHNTAQPDNTLSEVWHRCLLLQYS